MLQCEQMWGKSAWHACEVDIFIYANLFVYIYMYLIIYIFVYMVYINVYFMHFFTKIFYGKKNAIYR